ncbi:MAG: hypothetical protein QG600_559 [Patescibacteria group bacterium]|nr:hypothetical protein [Patescibacteria group bacterium]
MATRQSISSNKSSSNDYVELKLPKFPLKAKFVPLLVGALLVLISFGLGYQTAKVSSLERQLENSQPTVLGAQPTPTPGKQNVSNGTLPLLGNKDAKVVLVEFSDFQCPFCKSLFDGAYQQIKKDFVDTGKVAIAFRHYPLPNHPLAPLAAEASECANDQGKFWEYHDQLFINQESWSPMTTEVAIGEFTTYAANLGLDTQAFSTCLTTEKYADKVSKDLADGQAAKVNATPTTFVNGQPVVGALPYDAFKTIIEQELK